MAPRTPIVALAAFVVALAAPAHGADAPLPRPPESLAAQVVTLKSIAAERLREDARQRFERVVNLERHLPEAPQRRFPFAEAPGAPGTITSLPTGIRVNSLAGDGADWGQSEASIASRDSIVVAAWNDGAGIALGTHIHGWAYSIDGGTTFTDGGSPPNDGTFIWRGDPVVTVNETTGEFWVTGIVNATATTNGIAVARLTFSGAPATPAWGPVVVVRSIANSAGFLDKPWIAADSSNGNVYLLYTHFTNPTFTSDEIDFHRLPSGGSWSAATRLSSLADDGLVQGARVAVGPNGEVYAVWKAVSNAVAEDFFRFRASTDAGLNFGLEVTPAGFVPNFGTGAPGFNRPFGIDYPSMAVDRTFGSERGRIYIAWHESYNHFDESFGLASPRSEVEPNGTPGTATSFTPGQVLRGNTAAVNPQDLDYYSVTLSAGQHVVVWADSFPASQTYELRLFAPTPENAQRLCFGGDLSPGTSVSQAFYTFTAPTAGTYFVRFAPAFNNANSKTGNYRIRTAAGARAAERGRDQRDVFVTHSDDGVGWSTPSQANHDAAGYANWLPEVLVGPDGCPYVFWFHWSDDPYGSRSNQRIARSADGGATWNGDGYITLDLDNWTTILSNIAPNQGDYSGFYADAQYVRPIWADGRLGTADVFTTQFGTGYYLSCTAESVQVVPGSTVDLTWALGGGNPVFGTDVDYTFSSARGWPLPAGGSFPGVPDDIQLDIQETFAIPDTAAAGWDTLCMNAQTPKGTHAQRCCIRVAVTPAVAAEAAGIGFGLKTVAPNPSPGQARIGYALPHAGRVRLRIHGLAGERVRTLADEVRPAGLHWAFWDGRDDRGRAVRPGVYHIRLEGLGLSARRSVALVR